MRLKWTAVLAVCLAGGAQASGFALIEQNASGLGNAYAGQAAVAEDASTIYFNPAGLSLLEGRQVVVAGNLIAPSAKFSGPAAAVVVPAPPAGNGGDAGTLAFVPNFYYAMDIGAGLKVGVGLNAPFGLVTEYDSNWLGQSQAVKSDLKTYNLNPTLAWKVSDKLSLGFGLNWQYVKAELTSRHPVTGALLTMSGDDNSLGWNAGALWNIDGNSRLGVSYRSSIDYRLDGDLNGTPVVADLEVPASASLSYWRRLTPTWELLTDLSWTQWSDFQNLDVVSKAGGVTLSHVSENWDDTWRYSVGFNYRPSRDWTWRFGVAYDQAPVPDASHRTPRIPDADRFWIAVGGQYRLDPKSAVDFGYAHIFVNEATITHCDPATTCPVGVTLTGQYNNKIDILSVQYTHNF